MGPVAARVQGRELGGAYCVLGVTELDGDAGLHIAAFDAETQADMSIDVSWRDATARVGYVDKRSSPEVGGRGGAAARAARPRCPRGSSSMRVFLTAMAAHEHAFAQDKKSLVEKLLNFLSVAKLSNGRKALQLQSEPQRCSRRCCGVKK